MGASARRAWDVHVIDVLDADPWGGATVCVYDPENDQHTDVRVSYAPENGVEITCTCPLQRYGSRIAVFVERDSEVCELVAARVREAVDSYDPR